MTANDTNTGNDAYDVVLGERLAAALRAEADSLPVPPRAWSRFQDRDSAGDSAMPGAADDAAPEAAGPLVIVDADGSREEPAPAPGGAPRVATAHTRRHAWRAPLIAAAAVVAIAVTASAIVTGGFRGNTGAGPAAVTSGGLDPAAHVIVPIDASPEIAAVIDSGGAPASSIMDQTAISATPGPPPTVRMIFDAPPPTGTLAAQFDPPIGATDGSIVGSAAGPDGDPLGYVSVAGDADTSTRLLWGAVGPEVAQLRVVVTTDPPPGADPAATSGSATWFIDSGTGTGTAFLSAAAATVWTDMPYGYHAFALRLPASSTVGLMDAVDHDGDVIQKARLDLTTGERTDLPVPPPSSSDEAPFATSTAASDSPVATTATGLPAAPSSLEIPASSTTPNQSNVRCLGCGTPAGATNDPLATGGPPPAGG